MTDELDISKVKDLAKEREKRKPKIAAEKEVKIALPVLFQAVTDAINRVPWSALPPFPQRFSIFAPSLGGSTPVTHGDDDVLAVVENNNVIDRAIMEYVNRELGAMPDYRWAARTVEDCRRFWFLATPAMTEATVARVRWLSEPGPCFNRLPWDQTPPASSLPPTWGGLLRGMTNVRAFCAWVGSIFIEESYNQQYVFCHGLGRDGKGAIGRFFRRVLGAACCSKDAPSRGDKFWTYELIGKRLVIFPDSDQTRFVSSSLFKQLTGGDAITAEAKGRQSFTYQPRAKYLYLSNDKPAITSEESDIRRILYCEFMRTRHRESPGFEEALWDEGGAFLSFCLGTYAELCPTHGKIPLDESDCQSLEDWLSVVEEKFEVIYQKHFIRPPHPYDTIAGLHGLPDKSELAEVAIFPDRMQNLLEYYFGKGLGSGSKAADFRKWLQFKHGVIKRTLRLGDGSTPKVYVGLAETSASRGQPIDLVLPVNGS